MPGTLKENNFIWLTIALIGMLLAGAFSREFSDSVTLGIMEYSSVALMLISLASLQQRKTPLLWLILLILLLVISIIARSVTGARIFDFVYLVFVLSFLVTAAWLVSRNVLLTGTIDINKMVGSIALYMLLALIWSVLYTLVLEFWPDAFNGIDAGPWYKNLPTTTYFSFVTLTTLGYGDISPNRPLSEVLVILEAVAGMFYLAIVVASMVGAMREKLNP